MKDPIEQQRARLWSAYLEAPEECRAIVNLLAVNWGSLSRTDIRNALRPVIGKIRGGKLEPSEWVGRGLLGVETAWNGGERYYCHPRLSELVVRDLVSRGGFAEYVELARAAFPLGRSHVRNSNDIRFENDDQLIREVRIGMYLKDEAYISHLFDVLRRNQYSYWDGLAGRWPGPERIYALVCEDPFDLQWFQGLPSAIQQGALAGVVDHQLAEWRLDGDAYRLLVEFGKDGKSPNRDHDLYSAGYAALLRGEADRVDLCLRDGRGGVEESALEAWLTLLQGGLDEGIRRFDESLKLLRKLTGRRKTMLGGIAGVIYVLALSLRNRGTDMEEARKLAELVTDKEPLWPLYRLLRLGLAMEAGEKGALESFRATLLRSFASREFDPWTGWLGLFILHRYDHQPDVKPYLPKSVQACHTAQANGLQWLAAEMGGLIARLDPAQQELGEAAERLQSATGYTLLVSRVRHEAPWERALNAISNAVAKVSTGKVGGEAETRLAWLLTETKGYWPGYALEPREQKRGGGGTWSKGKILSLKKVVELANVGGYFTEQDLRVATNIVVDRMTRGYELSERGWLALAGHPHLFDAISGTAVELVVGEPELRVTRQKKNGGIRLEFWPALKHEMSLELARDGLNRIKAIEIRPEHRRLAEILGAGITAPAEAKDRVLASLGAVASLVTIHSDIAGGELSAAESVDADSLPRIQLMPEGEGLRVAILVRPFGDKGSYLVPGCGSTGLIAEIDGKRLQTQRDLKRERKLVQDILEGCPSFSGSGQALSDSQWIMADAESSLELLLELGELGGKVRVEWPQGEKFRMLGQAGLNQFSLKLQQQRDWFSVKGELRLDNGEVIEMQRLLELLDDRHGRFIRLDEGRFLALTDAFRKRLEELRGYAEKHGKDQRITALAAPILDEIAGEVGEFKADAGWRKQLERLREAERFQPKLPSTLQAELRDYQREGFEWMARLAAWGVGACLADDMGLGKTLQAITLILSRAGGGPTLVVAPTSVCFNWHNEVARFAPTLNVKTLGPGDRQQQLSQLQAFDLLICSYGLLQQEAVGELLAEVQWRTIVLDEAQAIKNAATKRAKQAMALQGEFKLITTGTPVENHLAELWALFRFINPGLLGSLESFNRRFAGPIERSQDRDARQRLRRLIQPFILRRTKAQVLDELPERTEIELQVELSEREAGFYEALRRKLLEQLGSDIGAVEDKRFQVLAAITKLRRACCNPNLVAPELELSSSKLELFGEVLGELLENRHKALVFSQFVDHLAIIRGFLDERGVSYQYLDGQTPAGERKKRVEAFQGGEGDVFLISLKAGGTGLNLTAADYVIHMDPWWNPAVEDQASDRAHRIGQQRPVTVYRLVTKGTIEEQIVSLHRQKRDLADSLLEGGEISGKVGADELLRLIREA